METIKHKQTKRKRQKTILYKKQLRKLLPKFSLAQVVTQPKWSNKKGLRTILKIALIEANKQQRKTIRSAT